METTKIFFIRRPPGGLTHTPLLKYSIKQIVNIICEDAQMHNGHLKVNLAAACVSFTESG